MAAELTAEQLQAENAQLLERIAALRVQLGLNQIETEQEKERIRQIFNDFDTDGNGVIDREEFEVLAFEAGGDLSALTEENISATFHELNPSGDGRIQFEDFYAWLQASTGDENVGKTTGKAQSLGALRLKLQSKAWYRSFQSIRQQVTDEPAEAAAAAPAPATEAASGGGDGLRKAFNWQVKCGAHEEYVSGVVFTISQNEEQQLELREQVECPEEVQMFAHLDFGIKEGADEMQVGELVGMVDMLVNSIPIDEMLPMPVIHSRTVDVWEDEETEEQKIRVTFFSSMDPMQFITQMNGGQDLMEDGFGHFDIKLQFPFSLNEFLDSPDKTLSREELGFNAQMVAEIDDGFIVRTEQMISRLPPDVAMKVKRQLATSKFMHGVEFYVQLGSIAELYDALPEGPDVSPEVMRFRRSLDQLSAVMIGDIVRQQANAFAGLVATQGDLARLLREVGTGLHRVHLQVGTIALQLNIEGLDFCSAIPEV